MTTFKTLLDNSINGKFTFETSTKNYSVEINVSYGDAQIVVHYYRGKQFTFVKKETYVNLNGIFGTQTVEDKFNEIVKTL